MTTTFADLGVPAEIARRLADRGIDAPFDIQRVTIPDALAGRDLCGKAPTGSGKTIAFGIPLVARVKRAAPKRPKGLVLAPTRELALQVAEELRQLGDLRVLAVYGGTNIEPQIKALRAGVDIVVACPGRLLDVIDRKACELRDVSMVVLDEADRMADMGFLPEVKRILDQTGTDRQTLLFSATLDGAVDTLVQRYQHDPVVHEMDEEKSGEITHHFWLAADRTARVQLTAEIIERAGPTVVFSRTKHGADRIARQLAKLGVSAAAIHGNRSQAQRERALAAFHHGEVQALVATDVAARGIHVEGVTCVVHFDLPPDPKDYVHRSGRTGRAGQDGTVVALLGQPEHKDARKLARQAGIDVEITEPDISSLPAGYDGFAAARERGRQVTEARRAERLPKERGVGTSVRRADRPRPEGDRPRTPRPAKAKPAAAAGGGGGGRGGERGRDGGRDGGRGRDGDRPRQGSGKPGGAKPRGAKPAGGGAKPGGSGGGSKPRPSGAARRRVKREAQAESGETPRPKQPRSRRR
jgi:superfamily II DNA/RNA helicase